MQVHKSVAPELKKDISMGLGAELGNPDLAQWRKEVPPDSGSSLPYTIAL